MTILHPFADEDGEPRPSTECRFGPGDLAFACSVHHGVRLSLDTERCRKADRETHQPGDRHRYRIECEVCGQRGLIRVSVDPDRTEPSDG